MSVCKSPMSLQIQEEQQRSTAAAAKHDSVLQQLSAEHAHSLEQSSRMEDQHTMLRQHAGTLNDARQQHNAVAAELAAIQQEMTQLQITQWQPILAAFDQQLEVCCPLILAVPPGLLTFSPFDSWGAFWPLPFSPFVCNLQLPICSSKLNLTSAHCVLSSITCFKDTVHCTATGQTGHDHALHCCWRDTAQHSNIMGSHGMSFCTSMTKHESCNAGSCSQQRDSWHGGGNSKEDASRVQRSHHGTGGESRAAFGCRCCGADKGNIQ